MARKVLVLGEVRDGQLRNVSHEAISAAKTVAEGGEVVGVLLGDSVQPLAEELIKMVRTKSLSLKMKNWPIIHQMDMLKGY